MVCFSSCPSDGIWAFIIVGIQLYYKWMSHAFTCCHSMTNTWINSANNHTFTSAKWTILSLCKMLNQLSQLTFNTNSLGSPRPFWLPDYVSQSTLWGQKKKQNENIYPADAAALVPHKKQKSLLSIDQKLIVYNAINKEASWSFSKFILYFIWDKDEHGKPVHHKQSDALTVQCFLAGNNCFSPADILAC